MKIINTFILSITTAAFLMLSAHATDAISPNTKHASTLNELNALFSSSGITEQNMNDENATSPLQRGLYLLTQFGIDGEEIAIDGGGYRFPYVAVSRATEGVPWTAWNMAWDAQNGFYYTIAE